MSIDTNDKEAFEYGIENCTEKALFFFIDGLGALFSFLKQSFVEHDELKRINDLSKITVEKTKRFGVKKPFISGEEHWGINLKGSALCESLLKREDFVGKEGFASNEYNEWYAKYNLWKKALTNEEWEIENTKFVEEQKELIKQYKSM